MIEYTNLKKTNMFLNLFIKQLMQVKSKYMDRPKRTKLWYVDGKVWIMNGFFDFALPGGKKYTYSFFGVFSRALGVLEVEEFNELLAVFSISGEYYTVASTERAESCGGLIVVFKVVKGGLVQLSPDHFGPNEFEEINEKFCHGRYTR